MAAIHVATRKGLLTFVEAGGAGWRLERTDFLGQPVTMALADARDGALYAALNLGHFGVKLHRSDNKGAHWSEIAVPAFPAQADPGADAPSVAQIWSLEPAGAAPGELWAGTIPGGLFQSFDRGESWSLNESLWSRPERAQWVGGGAEKPGIHSVCVDPRDRRRLAVGVSVGGVWTSADGGATWTAGTGLRAEYMPPEQAYEPVAQDPHRLAQCPVAPDVIWCQHHNGIFLSHDGGATFTEITNARPSAFGFAVAVHPSDPATAWFVPAVKDECRVPVDTRLVVSRTRDYGESFDVLSEGLPPAPAFDLVYRHGLDIDATGTRLAMGSTTGGLWVGEDGGAQWTQVSAHLPPVNQVRFAPAGW